MYSQNCTNCHEKNFITLPDSLRGWRPVQGDYPILESDPEVATGAGHHSVVKGKQADEYYIIYHRHPLGATDGNNRVVCIERMYFDESGHILPVKITFEGVPGI